MKIGKIILGCLIIYGCGLEYGRACKELGALFPPGLVMGSILIVGLGAWLIGSGISQYRLSFNSFSYLKYFVISGAVFAFLAYYQLWTLQAPKEYVDVNGIKVSIGELIQGTESFIPDLEERRAYCLCVVEKLTSREEIRTKYRGELHVGQFDKIFEEISSEAYFEELGITDCADESVVKWTDHLANSMKEGIKAELQGTGFEETYDLEAFCDCLISEYRKYPFNEVNNDKFLDSDLGILVEEICKDKNKK